MRPYGPLTYLGTPEIGAKLRARPNSVANRENQIVRGSGSFQWLRDGKPIEGAIGQIYVVRPEDLCHRIGLRYSFKREDGREDSVLSDENHWALDDRAKFVLSLYQYPKGLNRDPKGPEGFKFWVDYLHLLESKKDPLALARLTMAFITSPRYRKELGLT